MEPRSPALQVDSLPAESQGKPKSTGLGTLSLLQRIFPTQESKQGLLHHRWILYQLSYQENPNLYFVNQNSGLPWWLSGKEYSCKHRRLRFNLGQEDPLEKEMASHSRILAWKIPWMAEPGRLLSMGSQRVRHDWGTSLHLPVSLELDTKAQFSAIHGNLMTRKTQPWHGQTWSKIIISTTVKKLKI